LADILIRQKIDSLSRCIARIKEKTPDSVSVLLQSQDIQDIISLNIERAVQQCVDMAMIILSDQDTPVPASMGEAFECLSEKEIISKNISERMIKAVGFRNILVHAYTKVDWGIVWKIIKNHIEDFKDFSREIMNSGY